MGVQLAASGRQRLANAMGDALNNGYVELYDGSRPDPDAGITTQSLLATLQFGADAFNAATDDGTNATASANAITGDSAADASGTASWFRVLLSNGTTVEWTGSITGSGGGGDMELDDVNIVAGQPVNISSFSWLQPQGSA